jgi:putative chitinase
MINKEQLKAILPQATNSNIELYLPYLNDLLPKFGIDNNTRLAAFLAQVGHESGQLRYNKEIWGPTAAQKGYEGRKDLGNVIAGDGTKFKGRGLIQVTGRANYSSFAQANGVDCVNNPALLEQPEYAVMTACWFWKSKKLNQFADSGDFKTLTKRINGGLTNYTDRVNIWERAKSVLL